MNDGCAIASPCPGYNLVDQNDNEIEIDENIKVDYYSKKTYLKKINSIKQSTPCEIAGCVLF